MKKAAAFFAISFFFLSACSADIPPMGFDAKITPASIKTMPAPLDLPEAFEGGPLYVFDVDAPDPTLKAYRKLRLARAEEIAGLMNEESSALEELLEGMPEYRAEIVIFLGQLSEKLDRAAKDQAFLRAYALDTIQRETVAMLKTTDAAVKLEALAHAIEDLKTQDKEKLLNTPTVPMLEYAKWDILSRLVENVSQEFSSSQTRAGSIIGVIERNKDTFDKKVRKLAKKYDGKIGDLVEDIDKDLQKIIETHLEIMAGFESLKAADYAFTMAMLEFTKKTLPAISKKTGEIKTNEIVSEEDKDFLVSNARFLTTFTDDMRKGMENVEPPPAFRLSAGQKSSGLIPPFMGVAHAGAGAFLDSAAGALKSSVREMGTGLYGIGKAAADAPFEVARKIQRGVGAVVSSVDTCAGVGMDWMANRYYGNARQDAQDQMARTRAKSRLAEMQGKQGAEVLRTGRNYLGSVEAGVGDAVRATVGGGFDALDYTADKMTGGGIKNVWGRDQVSWVAGKIGELTTGMATGFGKGIMNLTNPDATKEELLEGTIDTVFAFIGGSKAAVKASQAFAGARKAGQEVTEKFVSWETRETLKRENVELLKSSTRLMTSTSMTGQELALLCDNTRRVMANELKEKALKETEKSIAKILGELAGKTGEKIVKNLGDAGPGAKDFVTKGLADGVDALKATFGGTKTELLDNIAGSQGDNVLKDFTKWMLLPDQDAEALKKAVDAAAAQAKLDPHDPKDKEAIEKIQKVFEEGQKQLAMVEQKADEAAKEKALEMLTQQINKEETSALMTPVSATGSFSGKYKGSVSITLTPGGGPVSGSVETEFGIASISGQSLAGGKMTAGVSGTMSYKWYADGWNATTKTCSLGGRMSGTIGNRRASGTYSAVCSGDRNASGNWTASW